MVICMSDTRKTSIIVSTTKGENNEKERHKYGEKTIKIIE